MPAVPLGRDEAGHRARPFRERRPTRGERRLTSISRSSTECTTCCTCSPCFRPPRRPAADKGYGLIGAGLAAGLAVRRRRHRHRPDRWPATEGIARQPDATARIQTAMIIAAALVEGVALFVAVIAFLIQGEDHVLGRSRSPVTATGSCRADRSAGDGRSGDCHERFHQGAAMLLLALQQEHAPRSAHRSSGGLMIWTVVVFLAAAPDPQEVRLARDPGRGRGAGAGARGAARRGRAQPGRGGRAAGGAQEARLPSEAAGAHGLLAEARAAGGEGAGAGDGKDEAGAGGAAASAPAVTSVASATGRSPSSGARRWIFRWPRRRS